MKRLLAIILSMIMLVPFSIGLAEPEEEVDVIEEALKEIQYENEKAIISCTGYFFCLSDENEPMIGIEFTIDNSEHQVRWNNILFGAEFKQEEISLGFSTTFNNPDIPPEAVYVEPGEIGKGSMCRVLLNTTSDVVIDFSELIPDTVITIPLNETNPRYQELLDLLETINQ